MALPCSISGRGSPRASVNTNGTMFGDSAEVLESTLAVMLPTSFAITRRCEWLRSSYIEAKSIPGIRCWRTYGFPTALSQVKSEASVVGTGIDVRFRT